MKNLIVLADFPPTIGGPTIWYYNICKLLLQKGYRIFSLGGKGCPPPGVANLNPVIAGLSIQRFTSFIFDVMAEAFCERKVLVDLWQKKLLKKADLSHLFSYFAIIRRVIARIPQEEGIVLVSHANINSLLGYLLCKRHGKLKMVIRSHGACVLEFADKRPELVNFFLSQASYVNCVSSYIAQECVKKGANPANVRVIYSARDIPDFDTSVKKENIVLFCGYLEPRKDPMTFLKAIKEVRDSYLEFNSLSFYVIGDGILKRQMLDYCSKNDLIETVVFTGAIPVKQVWEWMKKTKVLVLPSAREPSGAVLTEAMAYRCYCIATNVGGIPELVTKERGSLFEAGDYNELANLIKLYFKNEEELNKKLDAAYRYVKENYSFEKAAEKLCNIFEKIYK